MQVHGKTMLINSEKQGIVNFNRGQLQESHYVEDRFTPIAIFESSNSPTVVYESETLKQIKVNHSNETNTYKQANPVMKVFMRDQKLFILDMQGEVQIVDL